MSPILVGKKQRERMDSQFPRELCDIFRIPF